MRHIASVVVVPHPCYLGEPLVLGGEVAENPLAEVAGYVLREFAQGVGNPAQTLNQSDNMPSSSIASLSKVSHSHSKSLVSAFKLARSASSLLHLLFQLSNSAFKSASLCRKPAFLAAIASTLPKRSRTRCEILPNGFQGLLPEDFNLASKLDLSLLKALQSLFGLRHLLGLEFQLVGHVGEVAACLLPLGNVLMPALAVHHVPLDAMGVTHLLKLAHQEVLQVGQTVEAEGLECLLHAHLRLEAALVSSAVGDSDHMQVRSSVRLVEVYGRLVPVDGTPRPRPHRIKRLGVDRAVLLDRDGIPPCVAGCACPPRPTSTTP